MADHFPHIHYKYLLTGNMPAVNSGPELPFADPKKGLLIPEVANILGSSTFGPNRTVWGALWLADTEMLQMLTRLPPKILWSVLRLSETSKVVAKCKLHILNGQSRD